MYRLGAIISHKQKYRFGVFLSEDKNGWSRPLSATLGGEEWG